MVPAPPVIDGVLHDEAWNNGSWETGFIQITPHDGSPPSQETSFRITYDDKNIYAAFKLLDTEPEHIEQRTARRDNISGDAIFLYIDSFHDHRTAFCFGVTAGGVKIDAVIANDGDEKDFNWDPVWYVKTARDESGWTAEFRIPLKQLRYAVQTEQVWGMQIERFLFRKEEMSAWQYIPEDSPGFTSRFGDLDGIREIKSQRRIELLPYSVSNVESSKPVPGNPFAEGRYTHFSGGLDGKIGITGDMTLDLTVNPDFGQVEADPSEVNLTAFETFFQEKRPFFIEGANITNFQITYGEGDFSQDNLFYSRRIGRRPQYTPWSGTNRYVDMPDQTTIATAMKLTGKTRNGISVGIIEAYTLEEKAGIENNGIRTDMTVEPRTNYFLGRLQKDYRKGDTRIGGMVTSVNRDIKAGHLKWLPETAYTGGLDFVHNWKEKTYYTSFSTVFSRIGGSKEAITAAQMSPLRYYQRPDADHVEVDPDATSLTGHGGSFNIGKGGNGHWMGNFGITWRSPGLELNDMGYLRESDKTLENFWMQYREWKPQWIFRNYEINFSQWRGWDFSGENIFDGANLSISSQFSNYWRLGAGVNTNGESLNKNSMRGGPMLRSMGGWNEWIDLNSDTRKDFHAGMNASYYANNNNISKSFAFVPRATWLARQSLSITAFMVCVKTTSNLQYIDTINPPLYSSSSDRYLFGRISQKTVSLTFRADYAITPDLTIQYYGQPFISAGEYSHFKRITNPRADRYTDRFHEFTGNEIAYANGEYSVTEPPNWGGAAYSFGDPDFNFRQFKSNLVFRWEYNPGSTFYFVWSQNRTGGGGTGDFSFNDDLDTLFRVYPDNIYLIKFNHWFSL
ncbi:DUF5916 domain-containing protein [candidate division KSB1 bacterium]